MREHSENKDLIDFAKEQLRAEIVRPYEGGPPIVMAPNGVSLRSVKKLIDEYAQRPERKIGETTLTTVLSFVDFVLRHKTPDSVVFVDDRHQERPCMTAVIDADNAGVQTPEGRTDGANWESYRGVYRFPVSPEWEAWSKVSKTELDQAAFAEYLEEHIADVIPPDTKSEMLSAFVARVGVKMASGAELMTLSRGLSVRVDQRVSTVVNLSTGEGAVNFEEAHKDDAGGSLKVPGGFGIGIPVFKLGVMYVIPVRLRYRASSGRVLWRIQPYRMSEVFEHAIKGVAEQVREMADVPVFRGAPCIPLFERHSRDDD